MGFDNLCADVIILVFDYVDLNNIFSMRRVCRYFNNVATDYLLRRRSGRDYMNDQLVSRLTFEELACNKTSNDDVSQVAFRLASLATGADNTKCNVESCRKAICVALTVYRGRRWVLDNLKCIADGVGAWKADAIMVLASWLGLESVVRKSLADGMQVNMSHDRLGSALYAAAFNDDESLARLLIAKGADVRKIEGSYGDALQLAAYKGSEKVVRLLLAADADIRISSPSAAYGLYGSPLGAAAAAGHETIVQLFLQRKSTNPNEEVVRLLLRHRAVQFDPECQTSRKLLANIAKHGNLRIVQLLLDSIGKDKDGPRLITSCL
ncbi:ankyrin repeat-containing domain protein [Lipomyces kononenkoae]